VISVCTGAERFALAESIHRARNIRANTTVFRNSFFVNTIPAWNNLQDETVISTTVATFKSRLKSEHCQ